MLFDTFFSEEDVLYRDAFCSKTPFKTVFTQDFCKYPVMDAKHDNYNLYLTFVVNGIKKDDIKITLTDDIIEVKFDKKKEDDKFVYLYQKISRKSFDVKWKINTSIVDLNPENVKTELKDGELIIVIPIKEEFRPKKPIPLKIS